MKTKSTLYAIVCIVGLLLTPSDILAQVDFGPDLGGGQAEADVRLLIEESQVRPGDTAHLGILIELPPGRHIYWRNPGGIGLPPSIAWAIPAGIKVDEIQWPIPQKYFASDMYSYVYENQVLLMARLRLGKALPTGPLKIKATVEWAECTESTCYLGKSTASANLVIGEKKKSGKNTKLFEQWRERIPSQEKPANLSATWVKSSKDGLKRSIQFKIPAVKKKSEVDFFPLEPAGVNYKVDPATRSEYANGGAILTKHVIINKGKAPTTIPGVLVRDGKGQSAILHLGKAPRR